MKQPGHCVLSVWQKDEPLLFVQDTRSGSVTLLLARQLQVRDKCCVLWLWLWRPINLKCCLFWKSVIWSRTCGGGEVERLHRYKTFITTLTALPCSESFSEDQSSESSLASQFYPPNSMIDIGDSLGEIFLNIWKSLKKTCPVLIKTDRCEASNYH